MQMQMQMQDSPGDCVFPSNNYKCRRSSSLSGGTKSKVFQKATTFTT